MSSGECGFEGCQKPAKGKYCPEHQAEYDDMLFDLLKDDRDENGE